MGGQTSRLDPSYFENLPLPAIRPAVGVHPSYVYQSEPTTLGVVERNSLLDGRSFHAEAIPIHRENNAREERMIFTVQQKYVVRSGRMTLLSATGAELLDIRKPGLFVRHYEIGRANDKACSVTVKQEGQTCLVQFTDTTTGPLTLHLYRSEKAAVLRRRVDDATALVTMQRDAASRRKAAYRLRVAPGFDASLAVALCVCYDDILTPKNRSGGAAALTGMSGGVLAGAAGAGGAGM